MAPDEAGVKNMLFKTKAVHPSLEGVLEGVVGQQLRSVVFQEVVKPLLQAFAKDNFPRGVDHRVRVLARADQPPPFGACFVQ